MKNQFLTIMAIAICCSVLLFPRTGNAWPWDSALEFSSLEEEQAQIRKLGEVAIKYKTHDVYQIENVLIIRYKILEPEKVMNYRSGDQEMVLPIEGVVIGHLKNPRKALIGGGFSYYYHEVNFKAECRNKSDKMECEATNVKTAKWNFEENYKKMKDKTAFIKLKK